MALLMDYFILGFCRFLAKIGGERGKDRVVDGWLLVERLWVETGHRRPIEIKKRRLL